jgi:hypothetical protein
MPTEKPQPQQAAYPMAFLNMARDYADAANELFMIADARPKIQGQLPLSSPLYLLYSHAAELVLKAFLQAKGTNTPKIHGLAKLYAQSRSLGLVIDQRFEIESLVSFLDSGNKGQGFRYFYLESGSLGLTADLSWLREVIPELIRAVEPHAQAHIASGGAKMTLVFGKPVPKTGVRAKS